MTRDDFKEITEKAIVILPIGAVEQHGPHLPVMTDEAIVNEIARKSGEKIAKQVPVVLGPTIPFGFSHHHLIYSGTLSLSSNTLLLVLKELLESVVKSGFQKIFIINGHGGNDEIIQLAARNAAMDYNVTVGAASYWSIASDTIKNYCEKHQLSPAPGHAGQFETSLMLVIYPELVKLANLVNANPRRNPLEIDLLYTNVRIEKPSIWKDIDGFTDDPNSAFAERGKELIEIITDEVARCLIEFGK